MQRLIAYVSAGETLGAVRDYANAKNATPPTFIRGIGANLHLRLFSDLNTETPYPIGQLENIVSWQWLMDSDWNGATAPKIVADNARITVSEVVEMIDDMEYRFTDITIPIVDTNTEEVAAWIGHEETMSGLHGQLIGFDADGLPAFVLQIKNFSIRNRLDSAGTPVVIEPEYLNEAQVRALIVTAVKENLPSISSSDTWVIGGIDTGKTSRGEAGPPGPPGESFEPDAVGIFDDRTLYDDEPSGFSYLATDTQLVYFRMGVVSGVWSDGVPLASASTAKEDYTSFDVYPNSTPIAKGTVFRDLPAALIEYLPENCKDFTIYTAIPADNTHKFTVRSYTPREQCDVVVDWGDGTAEKLADISDSNYVLYTGEIPFTQEYGYILSHTYTEPDKKYKVKIFGRNYDAIEQNASTTSGNILCDCLGVNNRVASHIFNLSSFAKYALRLLNVQAGYYRTYGKMYNYSSCFTYSHNLVSISGFALPWGNTYSCARACQNCYNLRYSDLRLPCVLTNVGAIDQVYSNCVSLTTDIARLLPSQPFMFGKNINMKQLFYACRSMTGVVPAEWFWMNPNVSFTETAKVFEKSAFVDQVPVAWGGTVSDDVLPKIAPMKKVVDNSSTSLTIYAMANTTHVYQKPLTRLYISTVDVSVQETTIYFTAGSSITVTLPASVKTIGSMSFEPNKSYVISIKDGVAVSAEVK